MNTPENYSSSEPRREDKELNAAEKFAHFCGQPLTGALSFFRMLGDSEYTSSEKEEFKVMARAQYQDFFKRLHEHFDGTFESVGGTTRENINKLLAFEHRDPLEEGVLDQVHELYRVMAPHF